MKSHRFRHWFLQNSSFSWPIFEFIGISQFFKSLIIQNQVSGVVFIVSSCCWCFLMIFNEFWDFQKFSKIFKNFQKITLTGSPCRSGNPSRIWDLIPEFVQNHVILNFKAGVSLRILDFMMVSTERHIYWPILLIVVKLRNFNIFP